MSAARVLPPAGTLARLRAWWRSLPMIAVAFIISLTLHGALLTVRFVSHDTLRLFKDRPLEVVLVNSKSAHRPTEAQVLAQTNLDGGGNADEPRRARTPLPATRTQKPGDQLEATQQRIRELEAQQRALLAQLKASEHATPNRPERDAMPEAPTPAVTGRDLASTALAMARLEAEIDRNIDAYNKRPRRAFIGTRAQEYRFAQYVEDWRIKVERIGTLNYPQAARGKVYGDLVLTVVLLADGRVDRVDINRSSGHRVLDEAARRIVHLAAPYAPFPPAIRRDTDILEITRTWFFTKDEAVRAQ